jgi:sugar phosphate isomerase/epimerase
MNMTISRRRFLSNAVIAVTGMTAPRWLPMPAMAAAASVEWGVCTQLKKAAQLKQAGFQYVEENVASVLLPKATDEEFEKKLAEIKAAPLPIRSCTGFLPRELKVVGPDVALEPVLRHVEIVCRRAQQAGLSRIVFGSGASRQVPDGFDRAKAKEQVADFCRQAAPIAGKHNIIIVLENLNKGECNFINRVDEALEITNAVAHPNFQQHADIYHMLREDEGPESIIKAGAKLKHCHIAEKVKRTAPGVAGDDFRPYFKALKIIGYVGGISIEGGWGKNFEEQLTRARAVLNEQFQSA